MARYSINIGEVKYIQTNGYDPDQKFDGIEYNAASAKAFELGSRWYMRHLRRFVAELPETDLNKEVEEYIKEGEGTLPYEFGGDDSHFGEKDIDDILMVRSEEKTTTEALDAREVIIFIKDKLKVPCIDYGKKHISIIGGKIVNGIIYRNK